MRIALYVVASLFLVVTILMSFNLARFNYRDVEDAPRLARGLAGMHVDGARAARRDQLAVELDALAGGLRRGAAAALATGVLALLTLAALYGKRWLQYLVPALLLVAIMAIPLNPYFERRAPAPPRSLAIVLFVCAAAGALAALGTDWLRRRRAAA
jgi:hypothetical protein